MRHELSADERNQQQRCAENKGRDHQDGFGTIQRPIQLPGVLLFHPFEGAVAFFAYALLEPERSQHRNQGQGKNQRADQGEGHRLRHGVKQLSRRPAQRVNRQISGENDRDRIKDGAIHILGGRENDFVEVVLLPFPQRQFAVDVLDHHHGAVDDDAEIDGANGKQIGGNVVGVQHDEGKQQRQRNGERDNDGGAEADQKEDQHDQHQHHAAKQIGFNRVRGQVHQFAAIVKGNDLDVWRQDAAIQFFGLGLDSLQDILRLPAAEHENDALDRIVILLKAELTQAGRMADGDVANVAHPDGNAFVAADDDVADVVGIAHQPDAAHVVELSALRIESAAGIRVIGGKSGD